jgi:hypothetical protein
MNRKSIYFIAAVSILAIITTWVLIKERNSSIRKELKDFAIADTASVTRIFLADKGGHKVLLQRKNENVWVLNHSEKARQDGVVMLLSTLKNLSVRTRVSKTAYNNTLKALSQNGIKCEIYTNDTLSPHKTIYVGGSTQDILGTFMMLENSNAPFVVEIPGFNGYLTPRFSVNVSDWRDRMVFAIGMDYIKTIEINYPSIPEQSFIINNEQNIFSVVSPSGNTITSLDTIGLNTYLSFFSKLGFESWDKELSKVQKDSLLMQSPLAIISVTDLSGAKKEAILYRKAVNKFSLAQYDEEGNPLIYDRDRLYALINGGQDLVVIQYFVFGKILKQLKDFDLTKKK